MEYKKAKENKNSSASSGGKLAFYLKDSRTASIEEKPLVQKYFTDNRSQSVLQKKENNGGLPDQLKTGIENLSGHSMDAVKVHYNSSKPAQLNAHAYAQGTDIHIAPGQEKHLPHEAWHVVQQAQGRVPTTTQLKGTVNINDDGSLEKEADVMGQQALQMKRPTKTGINMKNKGSNLVNKVIQRVKGTKRGVVWKKKVNKTFRVYINFGVDGEIEVPNPSDLFDKLKPYIDGTEFSCIVNHTQKGKVTAVFSADLVVKDESASSSTSAAKKTAVATPEVQGGLEKGQFNELQVLLQKYQLPMPLSFKKMPPALFNDIFRYLELMLLLHNTKREELLKLEKTSKHSLVIAKFLDRIANDNTFSQKPLTDKEIKKVFELSALGHPATFTSDQQFGQILTGSVGAMNQGTDGSDLGPPQKITSSHALSNETLEGRIQIFVHGSSIAGLRGRPKPGKGWIFDETSDIDVAIVDSVRFSWAQVARITTYADNETVELNNTQLSLLGLMRFASTMRDKCGKREVNFSVYRTAHSGAEHSGWSLSCMVSNSKSGPDAKPVIEGIARTFSSGSDPFALEHQNKTKGLGQGVAVLGYSRERLLSLQSNTKEEEIAHSKSLDEQKTQTKSPTQGNHLFNEPTTPMKVVLNSFHEFNTGFKFDHEDSMQITIKHSSEGLCQALQGSIKSLSYLDRSGSDTSITKGYFNLEKNVNAVLYSNASVYFKNISQFLRESFSEVCKNPLSRAIHIQNLRILFPLWLNSVRLLLDCSVDTEVVAYLRLPDKKKEVSDRARAANALKNLARFEKDKQTILLELHSLLKTFMTQDAVPKESFEEKEITSPQGHDHDHSSQRSSEQGHSLTGFSSDYGSESTIKQVEEQSILQHPGMIKLSQIFKLKQVSGKAMNCLLRCMLLGYEKEGEDNVTTLRKLIVSNTGIDMDEMIDVTSPAGEEVLRIIAKNFGACTVNIIQLSAGAGEVNVILKYNLGAGGKPIYVLHLGAHFSYLIPIKSNPLNEELFRDVQVAIENVSLGASPKGAKKPATDPISRSKEAMLEGIRFSSGSFEYGEVETFKELLADIANPNNTTRIDGLMESANEWAEAILRRLPPKGDRQSEDDHTILTRMARSWLKRPDLTDANKRK